MKVPLWRFTVIGSDPPKVVERGAQYCRPAFDLARSELGADVAYSDVTREQVGEVEEQVDERPVRVVRRTRRARGRMVGAERGA